MTRTYDSHLTRYMRYLPSFFCNQLQHLPEVLAQALQGLLVTMAEQRPGQSAATVQDRLVAFKLDALRKLLDPAAVSVGFDPRDVPLQRKNIEFVIKYYENGGQIPSQGQYMYILDGQLVDKRPVPVPEGSILWVETVCSLTLILNLNHLRTTNPISSAFTISCHLCQLVQTLLRTEECTKWLRQPQGACIPPSVCMK